jgi:glycogen debranching enzyme
MSEPGVTGSHVLKSGQGFLLLDAEGRVSGDPSSPHGFFFRDTRHIRAFRPLLNGRDLIFRAAKDDGDGELVFDYVNPAMPDGKGGMLPEGAVAIRRRLAVWNDRVYESCTLRADRAAELTLGYRSESGFDDIFDARNPAILALPFARRKKRGHVTTVAQSPGRYCETYLWQDHKTRSASDYHFSAEFTRENGMFKFPLSLAPGRAKSLYAAFGPARENALLPTAANYRKAASRAARERNALHRYGPAITSDNPQADAALRQAQKDLSLLLAELPGGPYPFAGIPWFCTPFGRDGAKTALLLLDFYPQVAKGVLALQAEYQAPGDDAFFRAEKGKIFHELRFGESSALHENPFAHYYGGVDTTPLFVLLAHRYFERTGDEAFIRKIWPNLKEAARWTCRNMDANGGYVRYAYDPNGLTQQGWKDSADSIFLAEQPGLLAKDPVALCEVQAYAHEALRGAAAFARRFADPAFAAECETRADDLKTRFNHDFWQADMSCYAMALDAANMPSRVVSSNAGLALLTGIVPPARAAALAARLMRPDSFSGYGIRTLAEGPGFDPESYHRGSVWPHDSALVLKGMARFGLAAEVKKGAEGLLAAAVASSPARGRPQLSELFCGHARIPGQPPKPYPSACAPQAWAAAALIGVLAACGPDLPPEFGTITLHGPRRRKTAKPGPRPA